jgi:hypothetical protein
MEAERRQITVLLTDMVGFAAFAEQAGEEAAFALMGDLWPLMDDAVREQGGAIQDRTGDGIMTAFGTPIAFEDAPLNACCAALLIQQRLRTFGSDLEAVRTKPNACATRRSTRGVASIGARNVQLPAQQRTSSNPSISTMLKPSCPRFCLPRRMKRLAEFPTARYPASRH